MIFRLPKMSDKEMLDEYVQEHHDNGEDSVTASMGLSSSEYGGWVERIRRNAAEGNAEWGRSLLHLCFDGERLVGLLSVRYELTPELSGVIGDIGYGVRPSERRKGYATAMLRHGLSVCKEKGLEKVILGCFKDNLASAATIMSNGGVLIAENDNYKKGRTSQYFEITL